MSCAVPNQLFPLFSVSLYCLNGCCTLTCAGEDIRFVTLYQIFFRKNIQILVDSLKTFKFLQAFYKYLLPSHTFFIF